MPLALKDAFNSIPPAMDADVQEVVDKVLDPILPKVVNAVYGIAPPDAPRNDLFEIFLTGICDQDVCAGPAGDEFPETNLNSLALNAGVDGIRPSEMLRLNMSIAPTAQPDRLGVLNEDFQGFPNGRRLTDDVVDIAIQTVEGFFRTGLVQPLAAGDLVDENDRTFFNTFPYVALPHTGPVNETSDVEGEFVSVTPTRILETREEKGQIGYTGPKPPAGTTIPLDLLNGPASDVIPEEGVSTAYLNVTAVNSEPGGWIVLYPCDEQRPTASNVNLTNFITHNLVAAKVDARRTGVRLHQRGDGHPRRRDRLPPERRGVRRR